MTRYNVDSLKGKLQQRVSAIRDRNRRLPMTEDFIERARRMSESHDAGCDCVSCCQIRELEQ